MKPSCWLVCALIVLVACAPAGQPLPPVSTATAFPTLLSTASSAPGPSATVTPLPSPSTTPSLTPKPTAPQPTATNTAPPTVTPTQPASRRYVSAFGIDYSAPDKYVRQGEQTRLLDPAVIGVVSNRQSGFAQVADIYRWMKKEFRATSAGGAFIGVSTTEQLLNKRELTGCHDWALVYASFARALGYPTVIVDTAGIPWIKRFQADPKVAYSGHVFIEVFVDGKWILIDSTNGWYMENGYDPANPVISLKAGFPGETADLYGFYVMRKGFDTWDYGIHSNAELQKLMAETARQVNPDRLVKPAYTFRRF